MKIDCRNFRARLADTLRGPLDASSATSLGGSARSAGLSWHAHVIHCADCRELLSEEEALDELLRSLPEPHLPRALAERVLCRLDGARRGVDLDRLLDLQPLEPAPASLARSVLARVHAEQDLDRLLEQVAAETAPAGLERRVLARLELARRAPATRPTPQPQRSAPVRKPTRISAPAPAPTASRLPLRIAAGFILFSLAAWGAWSLRRTFVEPETRVPDLVIDENPSEKTPQRTPVQPPAVETPATVAEPDEELLASLEIFEAWDLLSTTDGVDASLSTLDSLDEYLLDFEAASPASDSSTPATPAADGADSDPKNERRNG